MWCCFSSWSNTIAAGKSIHFFFSLSKNVYSICEEIMYLMRKSKTRKETDQANNNFYCCMNDKWISLNPLKTSHGHHLFLIQGFPLVPASIHAVARKKYFDDKWVMFQKLLQINRRCLHTCSSVCGKEREREDPYTCMFLYVFVHVYFGLQTSLTDMFFLL